MYLLFEVSVPQLPGLSTPSSAPTRTHMAIIHVSTGYVTAVDAAGAVLWQTPTQVAWTVWTQVRPLHAVRPQCAHIAVKFAVPRVCIQLTFQCSMNVDPY